MSTGWRKKQIMNKQQEQMEKRDPLEVVKIVVEALDDAYAAGVRNSSKRPEWVGLTDEEIDLLLLHHEMMNQWPRQKQIHAFVRDAEAKLKEKNGYA